MSNQWFRLYSEILNDPKVQILTEALRWRYVALLCLQSTKNYENRPDDEIALSLRVTIEEWELTRKEFIKRGLLLEDGKINGWEKRQYISDIKDPTASQRQKRYRDNKKVTRNDTVTSRLPDSDTDTDTERKKAKDKKDFFKTFLDMFPKQRRGSKEKALRAWNQALNRTDPETIIAGLARYLASSDVHDGFAKGAQAWLNDDGWENTYGIVDVKTESIPQSPEAIIATDKWTKIYIQQIREGGNLTDQGISYLEQKLGNDWRKYA